MTLERVTCDRCERPGPPAETEFGARVLAASRGWSVTFTAARCPGCLAPAPAAGHASATPWVWEEDGSLGPIN